MLKTLFIEYQLLTIITLFAVQLALALIGCTAKKTKTEDQRSKEPLAHEGRPSTVAPKMPPKKTSQRRKKMTEKELEGIAKMCHQYSVSTEMTKEDVTQKMEKERSTTATIVTPTKPRMKMKKKEKETKEASQSTEQPTTQHKESTDDEGTEGSYEEQMGDVQLIKKTDNEWEKEQSETLKKAKLAAKMVSDGRNVDHGQSPDDTLKNVSSMQDEQQMIGERKDRQKELEEKQTMSASVEASVVLKSKKEEPKKSGNRCVHSTIIG